MPFEIFLSVGTILMIVIMLFCGKYYQVAVWKRVLTAIIFTVAGVIGVKIMAYVEMGRWGGRSFFGAVLFTPIIMIFYAYILKEKPTDILDLCAPSEAIMLALMKVDCTIVGCCFGRIIGIDSHGIMIRFPSQITECITAVIICIILILMIYKGKQRGTIYCWYMILYGIVRFFLNWMRETSPFIWILPAGNFWALITLGLGLFFLYYYRNRKQQTEMRTK